MAALAGVAVLTALIASQELDAVIDMLATAGWGIALAACFKIVPIFFSARGWQILMPGRQRGSLLFFMWVVWVREAVNALLPVARVGGQVVGVRLMIRHGLRTTPSVAATVVDVTLGSGILILVAAIGITLFHFRAVDQTFTGPLLIGLALAVVLASGILCLQQIGVGARLAAMTRRHAGKRWRSFIGSAARFDRALQTCWQRRMQCVSSTSWQFVSWCLGGVEIWLLMRALGIEGDLADGFIIEALLQVAIGMAFFVPGAIGVQEGVIVAVGVALGLTPEQATALALARRARDLLVFLPALAGWQTGEFLQLARNKDASPN
jgi:putative membrane protein